MKNFVNYFIFPIFKLPLMLIVTPICIWLTIGNHPDPDFMLDYIHGIKLK